VTELASPRQRVWFRLREGLERDDALDRAAGLLMREKPDGTALLSLALYPPGQGAHAEDPRVETFMWELLFKVDESAGRDWGWGDEVNARLAEHLRGALAER
jgi:hypothetical protein